MSVLGGLDWLCVVCVYVWEEEEEGKKDEWREIEVDVKLERFSLLIMMMSIEERSWRARQDILE